MTPWQRLRRLPLAIRVPAIVALLMVIISAAISERVLDRLARTQETYLNGLAAAYLDGLTSAIMPSVMREDSWEIFDTIERISRTAEALRPVETVVTNVDDVVLASSNPESTATDSVLGDVFKGHFQDKGVTLETDSNTGFARQDLVYQGQTVGRIYATLDVSGLIAERRHVLLTLLLTNGLLAASFGLVGFVLVRRMIQPMHVLQSHMTAAAAGALEPIGDAEFPAGNAEAARMFHAYNALVSAERERSTLAVQLAEEEKLASLGRLASGMAHEINNPLGGLMNAVDTLKKHGSAEGVKRTSLDLIERGLTGIREVVEAALATYRPERSMRPFAQADLNDVRLLLKPELRRKRQILDWQVSDFPEGACELPGGPIRQAILNLLLNAIAATPDGGRVSFSCRAESGQLFIGIADQGPGLAPEVAGILTGSDPGPVFGKGHGLGIWMVRQIAVEIGARIDLVLPPDGGTCIRLAIPMRQGEAREVSDAA
jgi:two-component system, OmpR family, sensor kinase